MLSAELVKDINQTGAESRPTQLAKVGNRVFFAANDGTHGIELWASDGTGKGTYLVKDINPGPGDSSPRSFADINGIAYFSADDGVHGLELWRSDGTESGTVLIKDLDPSYSSDPSEFISFNGETYFISLDYYTSGLWKTDGTEAGTVLVKGGKDALGQPISFRNLTRVGNQLFMSGGSQTLGSGLWTSDGTGGGTVLVKQVGSPQNFHEFHGMLLFVAQTSANGYELWRSDGSEAGTLMLKDIVPGTLGGVSPYSLFTEFNDLLWFGTYDANTMWRTDGTSEGTVRTSNGSPSSVALMNGNMYFVAPDGNGVSSLWKMGGTGPAQFLKGFTSDPVSPSSAQQLTTVGNHVLFTAPDAAHGTELWSTDGTPEGTSLLKDIEAGADSSAPGNFIALDNRAVFTAYDERHGLELWQSDGTERGTTLVKDINLGTNGGTGDISVVLNDTGYFIGASEYQPELWKTNGTADGTQKIVDLPYSIWGLKTAAGRIFFTAGGHNFSGLWASDGTDVGTNYLGATVDPNVHLVGIGDTTYFSPNAGTPGLQLWRTDGTPGGTRSVKTINPTLNWFSTIWIMEALNEKVFFSADDGTHGAEPWISDGTDSGTFMLADIASGAGGSNPIPLAELNNQMLFTAAGSSGLTLWKTDGTGPVTVPLATLGPGYVEYSIFRKLEVFDGKIFFELKDTGGQNQLWVTDGTTAGTLLLLSMSSDTWTQVGNEMFFVAYAAAGRELWKTDGTPAGTIRVNAIGPAPPNTYGGDAIAFNGVLLFSVNDGVHGNELWRSDGTEAGTYMIGDLNPGAASFYPSYFTEFEGAVYFVATDPDHGTELWQTDGTAAGTTLVEDIFPGPIGSYPSAPKIVNGNILFTANHPLVGGELWRVSSGLPDFMTLSADGVIEWSSTPDGPVLSLHHGSLAISRDLSTAHPGISILADNDAVIYLAANQHFRSLTLLDSARLDLGKQTLYLSPSSSQELSTLRGLTRSGKIFASASQADGRLGLGYEFDATINSMSISPALLGDLNLDGTVSIADFIDLASHFGQSSANWSDGDLNYDDEVSIADFIALAANFGQTSSPVAAQPQPASSAAQVISQPQRARRRSAARAHHRHRIVKKEAWSAQARRWLA